MNVARKIKEGLCKGKIKMICSNCEKVCKHLGATVGGTQLYGCPECKIVYFENNRREE